MYYTRYDWWFWILLLWQDGIGIMSHEKYLGSVSNLISFSGNIILNFVAAVLAPSRPCSNELSFLFVWFVSNSTLCVICDVYTTYCTRYEYVWWSIRKFYGKYKKKKYNRPYVPFALYSIQWISLFSTGGILARQQPCGEFGGVPKIFCLSVCVFIALLEKAQIKRLEER